MGIFDWLFGRSQEVKIARAAKYGKRATGMKNENPDAAIQALQKAEKLQRQADMHPYTILQTRLRMATAMYGAGEFERAEEFLLRELDTTKRMPLEKKADTPADFYRNLCCKAIYAKLRTCYERAKRFDKALPFAVAEAYAGYENRTHDMYADNPQPDYKAVARCLAKLGRPDLMPAIQAAFAKYAQKPDSTKCWRLIDDISGM